MIDLETNVDVEKWKEFILENFPFQEERRANSITIEVTKYGLFDDILLNPIEESLGRYSIRAIEEAVKELGDKYQCKINVRISQSEDKNHQITYEAIITESSGETQHA